MSPNRIFSIMRSILIIVIFSPKRCWEKLYRILERNSHVKVAEKFCAEILDWIAFHLVWNVFHSKNKVQKGMKLMFQRVMMFCLTRSSFNTLADTVSLQMERKTLHLQHFWTEKLHIHEMETKPDYAKNYDWRFTERNKGQRMEWYSLQFLERKSPRSKMNCFSFRAHVIDFVPKIQLRISSRKLVRNSFQMHGLKNKTAQNLSWFSFQKNGNYFLQCDLSKSITVVWVRACVSCPVCLKFPPWCLIGRENSASSGGPLIRLWKTVPHRENIKYSVVLNLNRCDLWPLTATNYLFPFVKWNFSRGISGIFPSVTSRG